MLSAWVAVAVLFPGSSRAQGAKLSEMTDASFAKWLTGTEWTGESGGKRGHLWFATPGIIIWRWEFNPGVWDCRAAALISEGKGKVKWRWNPDAIASCTVTVADDLRSAALEDGLLGKWTLQPSSRKPAAVTGGKLANIGAAGFSAWLEKQGLRWRTDKLNFGKGRTTSYNLAEGVAGKFEIVAPGVVEVFPGKDRTDCLLVVFAPSLDGALIYANWGVTGAKVKGAPGTALVPLPVFNDPEPVLKTLSAMKKEDFEKWLVGTEWELPHDGGSVYYWFATPNFVTWRRGEHYGMGCSVTAPGAVEWLHLAAKHEQNKLAIASGLTTGELSWSGGKTKGPIHLAARRMPFPMHAPSVERMKELLPETRVLLSPNSLTFPASKIARWHWKDGKTAELTLTIPGPGLAQYSWPGTTDCGLLSYRSPTAMRLYWKWGAGDQTIQPLSPDAAGSTTVPGNAGGLFDMGLTDTKPIPLKKPLASVNALVVMDLDGARTAGGLSKLALTSLALTNEDAATITFNQPVGSDMKKALREVTRFHAIRQGGWPRGQKMELSFADKYSEKDGPSAAVACALLLESALRGVTLQPDFAVTGDMNADGSVQPIGGVAAKLRGATKGGCTCVAIPETNTQQATDLALTDGAAPFLGIQVFSIATFEEAAKLAVREDAHVRAVMDSFTVLAKRVRADAAALRQAATVNALRELTRQAPTHLSARFLLAIAEDKLPATLSPGGSLTAINLAIMDALESTSQELLAKSNLDRGKVAGARSRLQQLRSKLDKRTQPLTDAWIAWSNAIDRLSSAAAGGGKVEAKLVNDAKSSAARIQAEEGRLSGNAEFNEDLMK